MANDGIRVTSPATGIAASRCFAALQLGPGVEMAGGSCRSLVSRVIRLRLPGRLVTLGGWLRWRCGMTRRCRGGRNCGGGCGMTPASGRYWSGH